MPQKGFYLWNRTWKSTCKHNNFVNFKCCVLLGYEKVLLGFEKVLVLVWTLKHFWDCVYYEPEKVTGYDMEIKLVQREVLV